MTEIQNSKLSLIFIKACQICFGYWIPAPWNFASSEPANGRIPRGENLGFICSLVPGIWDLDLGTLDFRGTEFSDGSFERCNVDLTSEMNRALSVDGVPTRWIC